MNTRSRSNSSPPNPDNITTVFQDIRTQLTNIIDRLDTLDQRTATFETDKASLQDNLTTFSSQLGTVIHQIDDHHARLSSLEQVPSHPSPLTIDTITALLDEKFRDTYSTTLDSITRLSSSIADLHLRQQSLPQAPPTVSTVRTTGFFQKETKDFHVSRLVKLLDGETLATDSLQDLEIFYDSILSHCNTVALTTDLYPKYRDLPITFDFYRHLCQLDRTVRPSQADIAQAAANYKSFGTGIRKFLLNPKTIPQDTCPDSYLQLLSLRNEHDGFLILKNFIFLRSPQLDGKFRDFRATINSLIIHPGEHIRTFYARSIWLSNEISLANLADGTLAVLHEWFLALLRDTKCNLIIGETSSYWRQIREHRRNPTNLNADLPWSFNDVLRSLELAGVDTLATPSTSSGPSLLVPSFAASSDSDPSLHYTSDYIQPIANAGKLTTSYFHNNNNPNNNKHPPSRNHHHPPKPNPPYPSSALTPKDKHLLCKLCNNLHSSPWHTTDQCPLKDPTFIINKKIRENVMQHNNLYGKTNKNYNKNIDLPTASNTPLKAHIPTIANIAHSDSIITTHPPHDDQPILTPPLEDPFQPYQIPYHDQDTPSHDHSEPTDLLDLPTPKANLCSTSQQITPTISTPSTNPPENIESPFIDLICDPTDYMYFSS